MPGRVRSNPHAGAVLGAAYTCVQTVNVNITDTTNQGTALFRAIGGGAVIKNLTVTGTVTGTTHAAGLVGFSEKLADNKTNIIDNCIVSVDVVNSHDLTTSKYLHIGGVVGQGGDSALTIRNTVWNGSMSNKGHYAGGFVGWCDTAARLNFEYCISMGTYTGNGLFSPFAIRNANCYGIFSGKKCYYTTDYTLKNVAYIAYVLRGKHGDLLIDTGMPQIWNGLHKWLSRYDIRYVLLTHAHADHDWNAAWLQKAGVKILLSEYDRDLRQNYLSQPVRPTLPKYAFRNVTQWINVSLFSNN